ncbi:MAG TPA: AraC family transcriptional regulator [Azospirillum sp.]|nr:AraC family transcriptional regulator [Azospirillum sp.]
MDNTTPSSRNWVDVARDAATGVETIRAHFSGHAYDPHYHDEALVGVTEQGLQEFSCRHRLHRSTPGRVILIEPGEVHDGHARGEDGFTYVMLYLPTRWLAEARRLVAPKDRGTGDIAFPATLTDDTRLATAVERAFYVLRAPEMPRLARDAALDAMVAALEPQLATGRPVGAALRRAPMPARRAREMLHALMAEDPGLDALAQQCGAADRFQLSRAFRAAYGLSPHAYLVQLRLTAARRLLSSGEAPAAVAAAVGFADQSHLGRWFRRAYGLTPAAYRALCTNVPDRGRAAAP